MKRKVDIKRRYFSLSLVLNGARIVFLAFYSITTREATTTNTRKAKRVRKDTNSRNTVASRKATQQKANMKFTN